MHLALLSLSVQCHLTVTSQGEAGGRLLCAVCSENKIQFYIFDSQESGCVFRYSLLLYNKEQSVYLNLGKVKRHNVYLPRSASLVISARKSHLLNVCSENQNMCWQHDLTLKCLQRNITDGMHNGMHCLLWLILEFKRLKS